MRKIGVLGGTFNPVHNGHLFVAEQILSHFELDCILFLPNGNPPHKQNISVSEEDRLAMLKLALTDKNHFHIEEYELDQTGHSYTYITLRYLRKKYPQSTLYFIAGADNIVEIDSWKKPEEIFKLAEILFFSRPGYPIDQQEIKRLETKYSASVTIFSVKGVDISATDIRQRIYEGKSIHGLVPIMVERYISEHHLYTSPYIIYMKKLKNLLCEKRFQHTIGVASAAKRMAQHYHADTEKAYLAGLLHDCAKNLSNQEQLAFITRNEFPVFERELEYPHLLHSIAGSVLAKEQFQVTDKEILSAIRYHTIGRIDMTLLEKIIFLADLIEENRDFPLVNDLRKMAFTNLDQALLLSIENNINYLTANKQPVLKETYRIRESLRNKGVRL